MTALSPKDKRCYLVVGYAPKGMSHGRANEALNQFVENPERGLALCHDHFVDSPGGFALIAVETEQELDVLYQCGPLSDWDVDIHSLIFSNDAQTFLYQLDFTMTVYRQQRLLPLVDVYAGGALKQRLDDKIETAEPQ